MKARTDARPRYSVEPNNPHDSPAYGPEHATDDAHGTDTTLLNFASGATITRVEVAP